jgi:hypothetical protein
MEKLATMTTMGKAGEPCRLELSVDSDLISMCYDSFWNLRNSLGPILPDSPRFSLLASRLETLAERSIESA